MASALGQALRRPQGAQHRLHRDRPVRRDRLRDLAGPVQRGAVGHDLADEPDLLGLGREQVPTGQQDVGGDRVGDLAAQPDDRPAERVEAPAHLGHAEPGALAGDADVGALQDLGAAGDRRSLDGGDQRLVEQEALEQRLDDALGDVGGGVVVLLPEGVARVGLGHRLQVGAGAEAAARAGEDRDADVGVGVDLVPRLRHLLHHRRRQRVAALRPVHGEDHHVPVALDEQVLLG